MEASELDDFGRTLIQALRNEGLDEWSRIVDGRLKGERAKEIRALIAGPSEAALVLQIVPCVIDSVLHNLLNLIDTDPRLTVGFQTGSELIPDIREVSDGLAGELYGDEGWIARFAEPQSASR